MCDSEIFKEETRGCKISLDSNSKENCSKKENKPISIAPIVIPNKKDKRIDKLEEELKKITKEFLLYKKSREKKINKLSTQLNYVSKEFKRYKKENRKIKSELNLVKKELNINKRKLNSLKKSIKTKKRVKTSHHKAKTTKIKIVKKRKIKKKKPHHYYTSSRKLNIDSSLLPPNTPWIDIVVEDGLDIYQLSMRYYKKRENYKFIYLANKDVIDSDLKIYNGMSLRIPIIDTFEEQPMFINRSY